MQKAGRVEVVTYREELVQLDVAVGVVGDLEQRQEDVAQELLEVRHYLVRLEDITVTHVYSLARSLDTHMLFNQRIEK